jgi:hypothetical protein
MLTSQAPTLKPADSKSQTKHQRNLNTQWQPLMLSGAMYVHMASIVVVGMTDGVEPVTSGQVSGISDQ